MAGVRFEDVDLLGALSRIVDLHTQHYKEDFDLDKELISKLAVSDRSEDKQLLWMSRPWDGMDKLIRGFANIS